jgi:hypothetical protein
MTTSKFSLWVTSATNVAVLVSVALLVMELRQSAKLAELNLLETRRAAFEQAEIAFLDPSISRVWVKALSDPASMSVEEIRSMDAYQAINLFQALRVFELHKAGLIDERSAVEYIQAEFPYVFGTPFAKIWWEQEGQTWSPDFVAFARPIVEAIDEHTIEGRYSRIQEALRAK